MKERGGSPGRGLADDTLRLPSCVSGDERVCQSMCWSMCKSVYYTKCQSVCEHTNEGMIAKVIGHDEHVLYREMSITVVVEHARHSQHHHPSLSQ